MLQMTTFRQEETDFGTINFRISEDGWFYAVLGTRSTKPFQTFEECRAEALERFSNPVVEFKDAILSILCVEEFGAHEFNQVIGIVKKYKPWILKSSSK